MNDDYFVIYSQPNCKWCAAAKALLDAKGCEYSEYDISVDSGARDWFLNQKYKKVPQIFVDYGFHDEHIGGYDNLVKWFERGANGS